LDASVLVKRCVAETGSAEVNALMAVLTSPDLHFPRGLPQLGSEAPPTTCETKHPKGRSPRPA